MLMMGCRTTTELTASFSSWIARMLALERAEGVIEVVVRCVSLLRAFRLLCRRSDCEAVVFRVESRIQRCCKSFVSLPPYHATRALYLGAIRPASLTEPPYREIFPFRTLSPTRLHASRRYTPSQSPSSRHVSSHLSPTLSASSPSPAL
jgi:hypothetical protein